ncbi:MAG: hypothetical protein SBU_000756 [Candidatus Syntrophoarchaeum butanivorans]|uniref:Uncharacterized protein n=1 Tax=Candidatus Syntropharchaeum butanivorans TaxID=1839936 RepID=A0A1F2P4W0_9EURY|nr:MAG: hypothetical protein SBU_000756 [Candidatus Syntrophoarchaeum butanivorans]
MDQDANAIVCMAVFSSVMVIRFIYRHITQYVVEGVVR